MKTILTSILSVAMFTVTMAQTVTTTPTIVPTKTVALLPDQNPNFQRSRDKYMADSDKLTEKQGQTVQETYKAIDDVQAKIEKRELRRDRRQERRMARIQSRGRSRNGFNNNGYNNGYYNNGYNNNGAYNGYYNPNGISSPQYYSNNIYGNVGSVLNTAFLGLALWSILKR